MHWGGLIGLGGIAAATAVIVTAPEMRRYPIAQAVARERLATAPLPEPLLDMSSHNVSLVREDGALIWNLGDAEHRSVGRVTLEGDGASTETTVRFDLARNALGDTPFSKTRLIHSRAESIFREHVDSVLSGRQFNERAAAMGTARDIEAKPEMIQEYGQATRDQFDDVAAMLNGSSTSITNLEK